MKFSMKRIALTTVIVSFLVLVGFGCIKNPQTNKIIEEGKPVIDKNAILSEARQNGLIMDTGEIEHMKDSSVLVSDGKMITIQNLKSFVEKDVSKWSAAALADVTGSTRFGLAHTHFSGGIFTLIAQMGGLADSTDGSAYHGWLVKRGDGMQVVDVGIVQKINEEFFLVYQSKENLSSYDFFVLTLESNDGDSAPAEHLLEGQIR